MLICDVFKLAGERRKRRNLLELKVGKFSKNGANIRKFKKNQEMIAASSTSPPGGNQVEGLPPAPV